MRERWGTFSVRDHISDAPFVSDFLLYDRLVIPVPDPADAHAVQTWKTWQPEKLRECLNILGEKTDQQDGLALTVPWDRAKQARFASRMSAVAALEAQRRNPDAGYYMDPFYMTRDLLKNEFLPALPPGVAKAWAVAAYPSAESFRQDVAASDAAAGQKTKLAMVLRHRFFTPDRADPKHEMLRRAVDLSKNDAFRRKWARFYEWQENIIENEIGEEKAVEELEQLLSEYNAATQVAFRDAVEKFAFTIIPVAIAIGGAVLSGPVSGIVIASVAGLVEFTRFWKFDRKLEIEKGDLDAAAMVHDAKSLLSSRGLLHG